MMSPLLKRCWHCNSVLSEGLLISHRRLECDCGPHRLSYDLTHNDNNDIYSFWSTIHLDDKTFFLSSFKEGNNYFREECTEIGYITLRGEEVIIKLDEFLLFNSKDEFTDFVSRVLKLKAFV